MDTTEVTTSAARVLVIQTPEQNAVAVEVLARLRDAVKQVEKQRVAAKAPHIAAGNKIDEEANAIKVPLTKHIARIEPLCVAYDTAERQKAAEAARIAKEAAEKAAAELRKAAEEAAAAQQAAADQAAKEAAKALDSGDEDAALAALEVSEQADKAATEANMQAGNIDAIAGSLVLAAVGNSYTGRSYGSSGATSKSRVEYRHELVDINLVPEQYLVDPEDRIRKSALPRPSTTRPADIPGFRVVEVGKITTRV